MQKLLFAAVMLAYYELVIPNIEMNTMLVQCSIVINPTEASHDEDEQMDGDFDRTEAETSSSSNWWFYFYICLCVAGVCLLGFVVYMLLAGGGSGASEEKSQS